MQKWISNCFKSTSALLIIAASLFYILFGQGMHLHELDLHVGGHFDIHVHVHAHESQEPDPLQPLPHPEAEVPSKDTSQQKQEQEHRHEVSKPSEITGTLTTTPVVKTDFSNRIILSKEAAGRSAHQAIDDSSLFVGTSPPILLKNFNCVTSFTLRGPPAV